MKNAWSVSSTTALGMDFVSHTDIVEDFAGAIEARGEAFPEFADELRMFHERWIETLGGPIEENVALLRAVCARPASRSTR